MPHGSSKDQLKAKGQKRVLSRAKRALEKKGYKGGNHQFDDNDDSKDGYGFMPTPSQFNSQVARQEGGRDGTNFARQGKNKKEKNKKSTQLNSQTSIGSKNFMDLNQVRL
jgi:hypothetical protein